MKIVYTTAALGDLAEIAEWLAAHYPSTAPDVERRIRLTIAVIGRWPDSATIARMQRSEIRKFKRAY